MVRSWKLCPTSRDVRSRTRQSLVDVVAALPMSGDVLERRLRRGSLVLSDFGRRSGVETIDDH